MTQRLTWHLIVGMCTLAAVVAIAIGARSYLQRQKDYQYLGNQNALLGAHITQYVLEKAVDNGLFDRDTIFERHYDLIDGHGPAHYRTQYDRFFDRNVVKILTAFQANDNVYYAYVINNDGFVPAHTDAAKSKTKFSPSEMDSCGPDPCGKSRDLLVKYEAGHKFWEFRAPILVYGQPWGEFRVGIPVALANNRGREIAANTFLITIFSSLVIIGVMVYLIRNGLRPLQELTQATRQMAAGDVSARCNYVRKDEIGALAQSFNAMAETISQTQDGLERQVQERTAQLASANEGMLSEIAERKRAEEALRESQERFQTLATATFEGICLSEDGRIKDCNDQFLVMLGYQRSELLGKALSELMPPEFREGLLDNIQHGREALIEHPMLCKDGSYRIVEAHGRPILDGERSVRITAVRDITEHKRAEAARLQAERLRRSLLDNSAVGIFYGSPDRTILEANVRACAMFGYTPGEMQGQSFRLIHLSDEHFQKFAPQYASLNASRFVSIDYPFRRKDGSILWCSAFGTPLDENDAEKGCIWTLLDITALREAQDLARRLSRAVEQTSASVVMTDLKGDITFVNRGFCLTTGYEEQEALGKNPRILKSGNMPVAVYKEMWESLSQGRQWRGELQNRRKNGELFWESAVISPIKDEEGKITHYVAVKEDITKRKRAEEQLNAYAAAMAESNHELEQSNRRAEAANRSKSEFLANMSHEIRTPMTAIMGYAEILADSIDRPDQQEAVQTIKRNANHLLGLVNDILDLSKIEAGKVQVEHLPVSPLAILGDVVSLMRVRAEAKNLPLKLEYLGPIPQTIQSDPTRLRQILVNLVGNAIKFTETGGVTIAVRLLGRDTAEPKLQCDVIDTGVGMNPQNLKNLFQPFQQADASTTRKFGGTGLGLAISKRLATLLGGDVTASSTLGKGSIFTLTIAIGPLEGTALIDRPAEAIAQIAARSGPAKAALARLNGRILLAEDGPDNQRMIAFILRKVGAEVQICDNGQKAMEAALAALPDCGGCCDDSKQPFDVILMDMQMPVMDGYEATRRLRQQGYTRPILALTAHAMKDDMQKCLDAGCNAYLTKPIEREQFLGTIAGYLKQPAATNEPVANAAQATP